MIEVSSICHIHILQVTSLAAPIIDLVTATNVTQIAKKVAHVTQITLALILFVNNAINARNVVKTIAIIQISVESKPALT
jgi:hypothetical protein